MFLELDSGDGCTTCDHTTKHIVHFYKNFMVCVFYFILFYFFTEQTLFNLFIFLKFLAVLGLRFCARAFSSCGKQGPLFIVVRGPLTVTASPVAEHRLQTHRLSSCGSRAQPLRGMWDPSRPGLEPASPALAGRLSTAAPPGKPLCILIFKKIYHLPVLINSELKSIGCFRTAAKKFFF